MIVEVLHVQYVAIHNDNKNEVLSLINKDCQGIIVVDPKHVRSTSMRSSRAGPGFCVGSGIIRVQRDGPRFFCMPGAITLILFPPPPLDFSSSTVPRCLYCPHQGP